MKQHVTNLKQGIKKLFKNSFFIACTLLFGVICFAIGFGTGEHRNQWAVDEVKQYRENFKFLTGWGQKIGDFQLVTFDGGKNWYNYKYEENKGLVILGTADSKFIEHHQKMRDLIERAKQGEKPLILFYKEDK
jgi:hypothetical protein